MSLSGEIVTTKTTIIKPNITTTTVKITNNISTTTTTVVATTTTTKNVSTVTNVEGILTIKELPREKLTLPYVKFNITADKSWNVDYYKIKIDNLDYYIWNDENNNDIYTTPKLKPGGHIIEVIAVNEKEEISVIKKGFVIKPLKVPIFKNWFKKVSATDEILIEGSTDYPSSEVGIVVRKKVGFWLRWWIKKSEAHLNIDNDQTIFANYYKVITDENGNFALNLTGKLSSGIYFVIANVIDSDGASSYNTEEYLIKINSNYWWNSDKFIGMMVGILWAVILIFIVMLSFIAYRRYCPKIIKKIKKSIITDDQYLRQVFNILIKDLNQCISLIVKGNIKENIGNKELNKIEEMRENLECAKKILKNKKLKK